MALALLIVIWGVFLVVSLVRKRAEYRADSSIGAFQRQLQVLGKNSERMHGGHHSRALTKSTAADGAGSHRDYEVARHTRPFGEQDPYFRREACERRRDVLLLLTSALVGSGLVSIIPAARMMLVVTAVAGTALAVYLVMLVRLRAQAAERETKLRYIYAPEPEPVYVDRRFVAR